MELTHEAGILAGEPQAVGFIIYTNSIAMSVEKIEKLWMSG